MFLKNLYAKLCPMKSICFTVLLLYCLPMPLTQAADIQPEGTAARKLQRGFLNIALFPMEISTGIAREGKEGKVEPTWFFGGLKGIERGVYRAVVGIYEIVTFPFPGDPIVRPEFPWQHFDEVPETTS